MPPFLVTHWLVLMMEIKTLKIAKLPTFILYLSALGGCEYNKIYNLQTPVFSVVVQKVPDLPVQGTQEYIGGRCVIKLRKYPVCLQHEIRHCIEGDWHEGVSTTEDCFE